MSIIEIEVGCWIRIILPSRDPIENKRPKQQVYISQFLLLIFLLAGVFPIYAAQPPTNIAIKLMSDADVETAIMEIDNWVEDNPGDPLLFPTLLKLATSVPHTRAIEAILSRYQALLDLDQIGVLRSVPADWAELNGSIEVALKALEQPDIPNAYERRILLMTELGRISSAPLSQEVPIGLTSNIARYGEARDVNVDVLEKLLRATFNDSSETKDGGYAATVSGYGLASLLKANNRDAELEILIDQMRQRYPNSPEYALVSTGLQKGENFLPVVAQSSPTTLMGIYALTCLSTCPSITEAIQTFLDIQESQLRNLQVRATDRETQVSRQREQLELLESISDNTQSARNSLNKWTRSENMIVGLSQGQINSKVVESDTKRGAIRVVAVPTVATKNLNPSDVQGKVRVIAVPDPAVFVVQSTTYTELDIANNLQLELGVSGFPAILRSLTENDGSIVYQVELIDRLTKIKAQRLIEMLKNLGHDGRIMRTGEYEF